MLTPAQSCTQLRRTCSQTRSTPWNPPTATAEASSRLTRLGGRLDARRSIVALANVVAAALFVAGCVGFYWPGFYTAAVTMFLIGSVLFLLSALSSALLDHGPSTS